MVSMGEVVSAVVQKNMPLKQKDPGAFTIPCVIGNASFKRALCNLGASISVMPKHVYDSLSLTQTVPHGNVFVDLVLSHKKLLSSILQALELELKPLPDNLKYVFIGDNNTLPVIIATSLTNTQEEKLVKLLCDHKTTIGWTLADIKGISPSMCMHHILLEDNAKPIREMQRRLNLPMMEVVKAEILKLLDAGVIYPITKVNEWRQSMWCLKRPESRW